ncbi:MAG TPA: restriction endonuclease [Burkholderiales bacterium]|nr:restriction endonuclease [Burkholderiales bacterium]
MKVNENSLFAVLLRSPWWVSALVAAAVIALVRFFVPTVYAFFAALPFIVISCVVAGRQVRAPGAKKIAATLERLKGLSSEAFIEELERGLRREGYSVERISAPAAELAVRYKERSFLVACRRWKASRTGVEPLKELKDACRAYKDVDAQGHDHDGIYVAAGEVTDQARKFAAEHRIELIDAQGLGRLLA